MVDVATVAIAAVGWIFAIFFGMRAYKNGTLVRSFFDAYVRMQRPIDFGGGRSALMKKSRFGTYAVEWTQQLGGTLTVTGDLQVRKIPASKKEG